MRRFRNVALFIFVLAALAIVLPLTLRTLESPSDAPSPASSENVRLPDERRYSRPEFLFEPDRSLDAGLDGIRVEIVKSNQRQVVPNYRLAPESERILPDLHTNFVPREKKFDNKRNKQLREHVANRRFRELTPGARLDAGGSGPVENARGGGPVITFESFDFNDSGAIPADPIGAVGPNHVVNVVNSELAIFDKSGIVTAFGSLFGFFSGLANTSTFDPRVLFDTFENRFVVITIENFQSGPQIFSQILVAVSDDADPNGTWFTTEIDAFANINGLDTLADFPALAVDEEAIYISTNQFAVGGPFQNARLWIIDKGVGGGGLYDNGPANVIEIDVPLPPPPNNLPIFNFTFRPARVVGPITPAPGVGTYFLTYNGIGSGATEVFSVVTLSDPLGTPSFNQEFVFIGDVDNSALPILPAPQPGGVQSFDSGDRRIIDAVWRDGSLYAMTVVRPGSGPDVNQTTAHWIQLDTSVFSNTTVVDQGDIGGEDIITGAHTFYPSVAVDPSGTLGFSFAASSTGLFGSAYFTFRRAGDPAGTVAPSLLVGAGTATYLRRDNNLLNRWGDYSGVDFDPALPGCFWAYNMFVKATNVWGTRWAQYCTADAVCGDGLVDPPETCDPPGQPAGLPNVCRANCTFCGDGTVQFGDGEECDDGNNAGGDGCDTNCLVEICGNGVVQPPESCEPPGASVGLPHECRSDCTRCGDGTVNGSTELIINGDFESGDFTGWQGGNTGSGTFLVSTPGSATPSGNPTAPNPAGGAFYSVSDQGGPGTHVLVQTFTVPSNVGVSLAFEMFVNNWNSVAAGTPGTPGTFIDPAGLDETTPNPNQHGRVDLMNVGFGLFDTGPAAVVRNFYIGADPLSPPENPYTSYVFDITDDVVPGQSYVLRFAETGNQFFINLGVDNVSIQTTFNVESCDDGNTLPGDGCTSTCELCVGLNPFGQTLLAPDKNSLVWGLPADVDFVTGDLAAISSYGTLASGSLVSATSLPLPVVPAGTGIYVVARTDCPGATWSSGGSGECPPGACPPGDRNGNLPEIAP